MTDTKRLRIFAGPNGSGKSTIINIIRNKKIDLGIYLNADEIKVQLEKLEIAEICVQINREIETGKFINSHSKPTNPRTQHSPS